MDLEILEPEVVHRLKNHLAVAVGFLHLVIDNADADDPRLADLQEIRQALDAAMKMMPELCQQLNDGASDQMA